MCLSWMMRLYVFAALVLATTLNGDGLTELDGVCDDGKHLVDVDLGTTDNWNCSGDRFGPSPFFLPAGEGNCATSTEGRDQVGECMTVPLHYDQHPPSTGVFRPLAPVVGEYQYLPPQRWLHTARNGGVVFLYHPCANEEHVEELRAIARGCLGYYVFTPYPHLTKEEPLAIVSWGCVYRMKWPYPLEIKVWLKELPDIKLNDGQGKELYKKGLLEDSKPDNIQRLCANIDDVVSVTSTTTSPPLPDTLVSQSITIPCPAASDTEQERKCVRRVSEHSLHTHSRSLLALTILLGVVLLGFVAILVFKVVNRWGHKRPKQGKYKSVSRHFPFSYKQSNADVVIPELGMPKGRGAERQVLLGSDEDEL